MATAELVVAFGAKVDGLEASLKRVTTRLQDMEASASKTNQAVQNSVEGLSASFSRLASVAKIAVIVEGMKSVATNIVRAVVAADDLSTSLAKLNILTGGSSGGVEDLFKRLSDVAAKTGQPVADLVDQFKRFYVATESLGTSQAQVEKLVETLARFAQVSGKGTQEASAAVTQLAQGLASGRLQGDELKSIMENMPLLAQALAKELNVSVGALRQMGEDGKLTADVVMPALLRAGDNLGQRLNGFPTSIRQAWQTTQDQFVATIRTFDRVIAASSGLKMILAAAQAFNAMANRAGQSMLTDEELSPAELAARYRERAKEQQAALERVDQQLAAAQNRDTRMDRYRSPAELSRLGPSIQSLQAERARLLKEQETTNFQLRQAQERADMDSFTNERQRLAAATQERLAQGMAAGRAAREQLDERLRVQREYSERIVQVERLRTAAQGQIESERAKTLATATQLEQDAARIRQDELDKIAKKEAGPQRRDTSLEDADRQAKEAMELARAAREASDQIVSASGNQARALRDTFEKWYDISGRAGSAWGNFIQRVKEGNEQLQTGVDAIVERTVSTAQSMQTAGQNSELAINEGRLAIQRLGEELVRTGVIAQENLDGFIGEAVGRLDDRLKKLKETTDRSFDDIKKTIVQSFSRSVADSLVDFATGAEKSFGKVAADFAKMVAKMILNWLIFRAVTAGINAVAPGFLGGTGAGTGNSPPNGRINPFATGAPPGVARSSSAYGESSPYFTGSAPLVPAVEGSSGGVTVNVINNANGTTTRQQERSNGLGGKEIDIYIEEVVRRGMASGSFDGTMSTVFGASRIGRV